MDEEAVFRAFFSATFLLMLVYRLYQHWKAETYKGSHLIQAEGKVLAIGRLLLAVLFLWAVLTYLLAPEQLAWAAFPVPAELRWFGTGVVGLGFLLLVWVHGALGHNFSTTLRIRPDHTLVTSGPYRWVRHPMYTVFCLIFAGIGLQTANWLLGGMSLLAIGIVMIVRTPLEEAQLLARFGEDYRRYMQHTGRFLPRLLRDFASPVWRGSAGENWACSEDGSSARR